MSKFGSFKNDAAAREAWGDAYDQIPKSVFALIAWHLANIASPNADTAGAAERRFLQEWDALLSHGASKPTAKALSVLRAAASSAGGDA